jgi:acyl carrier protein
METPEIAAALRGFIREKFGIPEKDPDFTDDVDLFNYGYVDSFGAVDLTSFIEQHFSIKFGSSDWVDQPMNTINQISAFVAKRQKGKK